jgi:hypothetical protein
MDACQSHSPYFISSARSSPGHKIGRINGDATPAISSMRSTAVTAIPMIQEGRIHLALIRIPSLRATAILAFPKPFWTNLRR